MKKRMNSIWICAISILVLIIDTKTASKGVTNGMKLCLNILLPSLFPFFIVSSYMNTLLAGLRIPGAQHLGRFLHIPAGGESILILGMLGGYPVGAQLIGSIYREGKIQKLTGRILLGYCSNAGPAFIFGVTGILFSNPWVSFLLWGIHMLSAFCVGMLLPKPKQKEITMLQKSTVSFTQSLQKSIRVFASVCVWVIMFKTIQAYLEKWLSTYVPTEICCILNGILELSSGCIDLQGIHNEAIRFILCSGFLAFGGVCVLMQTASVAAPLGLGLYLPGKLMQSAISLLLSTLLCWNSINLRTFLSIVIPCCFVVILIEFLVKKMWKS